MKNTTEIFYEGDNLKGCLWNIYLENELNPATEKEFIQLVDNPTPDFDHLKYLQVLVEEKCHNIEIEQFEDCVTMVIQ